MLKARETLEEDMASNTRIPKAELTGIYGAMVKRISRKMFGGVPEPVEVAWHNRKVLNFSFSLGRKAQKWDQCDENLKSFAHMAVASLVGCSFCLDLGYFQAQNEGLDETKAREVARWRESDVFTPLERDVMEYAEAMSLTPPTVTDELSAGCSTSSARPRWSSSPRLSRWLTCTPAPTPRSASSRRSS